MGRVARENSDLAEAGTVTVACKMPNGLILRVFEMQEIQEQTLGGSKTVKKAFQVGEPVTLHGNRWEHNQAPPEYKIIGEYALTENVDAQFFKKWMEQNWDSPLVKNKLIFGYESQSKVEGQAREQKAIRSGMEPINMDGDPRMPKDIRKADKKAA